MRLLIGIALRIVERRDIRLRILVEGVGLVLRRNGLAGRGPRSEDDESAQQE